MFEDLKEQLKKQMHDTQAFFQKNLKGLRTGRAQTTLLENLEVDAYGGRMPLNQLASITVQGANALNVQVWDNQMTALVEKAIREAPLGLNPQAAGNLIKVVLPSLTEERRKDLIKQVKTYAEQARVALRNSRRQGMESLKKAEKDKILSEDQVHLYGDTIQKLTDVEVKKVDNMLAAKEKDLMTI